MFLNYKEASCKFFSTKLSQTKAFYHNSGVKELKENCIRIKKKIYLSNYMFISGNMILRFIFLRSRILLRGGSSKCITENKNTVKYFNENTWQNVIGQDCELCRTQSKKLHIWWLNTFARQEIMNSEERKKIISKTLCETCLKISDNMYTCDFN